MRSTHKARPDGIADAVDRVDREHIIPIDPLLIVAGLSPLPTTYRGGALTAELEPGCDDWVRVLA